MQSTMNDIVFLHILLISKQDFVIRWINYYMMTDYQSSILWTLFRYRYFNHNKCDIINNKQISNEQTLSVYSLSICLLALYLHILLSFSIYFMLISSFIYICFFFIYSLSIFVSYFTYLFFLSNTMLKLKEL